MTAFGDWLLSTRKKLGLSQEELAQRANVSKNYISILERGRPHPGTGAAPQPSRKTVEEIAVAMNWPIEEPLRLAGYSASPELSDLSPDEERLIAFYADMADADKQAVITIAEALWRKTKEAELVIGRRRPTENEILEE